MKGFKEKCKIFKKKEKTKKGESREKKNQKKSFFKFNLKSKKYYKKNSFQQWRSSDRYISFMKLNM